MTSPTNWDSKGEGKGGQASMSVNLRAGLRGEL